MRHLFMKVGKDKGPKDTQILQGGEETLLKASSQL